VKAIEDVEVGCNGSYSEDDRGRELEKAHGVAAVLPVVRGCISLWDLAVATTASYVSETVRQRHAHPVAWCMTAPSLVAARQEQPDGEATTV